MVDGVEWPAQTLTQLEGEDWGDPGHSFLAGSSGLRHKPLNQFTAEDLRFMLGQQISLPVLMPMALDVLELVDPFAGGGMNRGTLPYNALRMDSRFWQEHPRLWVRMTVVLVDLNALRDLMDRELLPAAKAFEAARPAAVPPG